MRVVMVTDAWHPQVNGVVRTVDTTARVMRDWGHEVLMITPEGYPTFPLPSYPEVRLPIWTGGKVAKTIDAFAPDAVHIATEAPLGLAARTHCLRRRLTFTTAFHTKVADYLTARTRIPASWGYAAQRWFHAPAERLMVTTPNMMRELEGYGFKKMALWGRGVDLDLFKPTPLGSGPLSHLPRPILLNVGRVAIEKNLEAFLSLDTPGTKVVVGDGPARAGLEARFKDAVFVGYKFGAELAAHYADADVFVFPSRTDTYGLVMLEALACGTPIAAYPVTGPLDVVGDAPDVAALDENLGAAITRALTMSRDAARAHAEKYPWSIATREFMDNLTPSNGTVTTGAATKDDDRAA